MVEQFGKYKIVQEIGRGGFATVYQAQDTSLGGRSVALKLLSPAILHDPTFIQRFQREAETAAGLRHPHIITVYETGEVNSVYYLAMDYVAGGSLRDYLRQKKALPWSECAHILEQICSALAYAHERGVVHRDLKPANILIDPETGAIVTDFGFARLMSDSSQSLSSTGSGVLGTPAYIPVEVWEGKKGDHTSDIYALGCMLYEMITGQLLFAGDTPIAIMRNHDQGAQLPAQWPAGVPAGVGQIIRKATAKTPAERYGSVRELWQAVQQLSAPEVAPRPGATSTPAVPWAWLAAGGTVLALLLLVGGWLLGGRGTEKDNMESTILAQATLVYATNEALKTQNMAVTQTLVALSQVTPAATPTPSFTSTFTPTATKTNTLTPSSTPTLTKTPTLTTTSTGTPTLPPTSTKTPTLIATAEIIATPISTDWFSTIRCIAENEVYPSPGSEVKGSEFITFTWPNINNLPAGYFYLVSTFGASDSYAKLIASGKTRDTSIQLRIPPERAGDIVWYVTLVDSNGNWVNHNQCAFTASLFSVNPPAGIKGIHFWYIP